MKQVVTGLVVQVEVTGYDDEGRVVGRGTTPDGKPLTFQALEASIPEPVLEWVRQQIKLGG